MIERVAVILNTEEGCMEVLFIFDPKIRSLSLSLSLSLSTLGQKKINNFTRKAVPELISCARFVKFVNIVKRTIFKH